jgi:hypothetical protein
MTVKFMLSQSWMVGSRGISATKAADRLEAVVEFPIPPLLQMAIFSISEHIGILIEMIDDGSLEVGMAWQVHKRSPIISIDVIECMKSSMNLYRHILGEQQVVGIAKEHMGIDAGDSLLH